MPLLLVTLASAGAGAQPASGLLASALPSKFEELQRDFRETRNPVSGLAAARSLVQGKRLLEAAALYLEVSQLVLPLDAPAAAIAARARAATDRQELLRRIPAVVITIESEHRGGVQVSLNGNLVPASELGSWRAVDPGPVRVRAVQAGSVVEKEIVVVEGDMKPVRLVFAPSWRARSELPKTAPRNSPHASDSSLGAAEIAAYVAIGLGSAALVTGGVFGVLALQDEADLQSRCVRNRCDANLQPEVDAYESRKSISTVGLAAGAALVLGGAAVYLTLGGSEDDAQASRVGAYGTATGAGVWGTF